MRDCHPEWPCPLSACRARLNWLPRCGPHQVSLITASCKARWPPDNTSWGPWRSQRRAAPHTTDEGDARWGGAFVPENQMGTDGKQWLVCPQGSQGSQSPLELCAHPKEEGRLWRQNSVPNAAQGHRPEVTGRQAGDTDRWPRAQPTGECGVKIVLQPGWRFIPHGSPFSCPRRPPDHSRHGEGAPASTAKPSEHRCNGRALPGWTKERGLTHSPAQA